MITTTVHIQKLRYRETVENNLDISPKEVEVKTENVCEVQPEKSV